MKKVISFFVVILGFFSFSIFASADENVTGPHYDYINDFYIDGDILSVDSDGNAIKLTFEEYMEEVIKAERINKELEKMSLFFENKQSKSIVDILATPGVSYRYSESLTGQTLGAAEQVTSELICPSKSAGCSETYTVSMTKSVTWGAGVTTASKKVINAALNFSYSNSVSNSTSYTLSLKPGTSGYIEIKPYLNYSYGYLTTLIDGVKTKEVYVRNQFPVSLANGQLKWLVVPKVY